MYHVASCLAAQITIKNVRKNSARSSVDRVLASEAKGRAFDSRRAHHQIF